MIIKNVYHEKKILVKLDLLQALIESQIVNQKEVLNLSEASNYLQLSTSHLYKLTSTGNIPFYKPNGKKLYFKKSELDDWLLRNRRQTKDEIEKEAENYLANRRIRR